MQKNMYSIISLTQMQMLFTLAKNKRKDNTQNMPDKPKHTELAIETKETKNSDHSWNVLTQNDRIPEEERSLLERKDNQERKRLEKVTGFFDDRERQKDANRVKEVELKNEILDKIIPRAQELGDQISQGQSKLTKERVNQITSEYVNHIARVGQLQTPEGREKFEQNPQEAYNTAAFALKVSYNKSEKQVIDQLHERLKEAVTTTTHAEAQTSTPFYHHDTSSRDSLAEALQRNKPTPYYSPLEDS